MRSSETLDRSLFVHEVAGATAVEKLGREHPRLVEIVCQRQRVADDVARVAAAEGEGSRLGTGREQMLPQARFERPRPPPSPLPDTRGRLPRLPPLSHTL